MITEGGVCGYVPTEKPNTMLSRSANAVLTSTHGTPFQRLPQRVWTNVGRIVTGLHRLDNPAVAPSQERFRAIHNWRQKVVCEKKRRLDNYNYLFQRPKLPSSLIIHFVEGSGPSNENALDLGYLAQGELLS